LRRECFCSERRTGDSVRDFSLYHHGFTREVGLFPIAPPSLKVTSHFCSYMPADLNRKIRETLCLQISFQSSEA
jgi:hypothetical protein